MVNKRGNYYIGTSGWKYKHWKGAFYPAGLRDNEEFDYYISHFNTVKINNSFYRLPSTDTFRNWCRNAPASFIYAVKVSRYITHMKKLSIDSKQISLFFSRIAYLENKLGPLLFQLPPGWAVNSERLKSFLEILPKEHRYVFEFREHSWYQQPVYDQLIKHNCAFCIYDLAGHQSPFVVTANFVYIRLHGPAGKYQGSYIKRQLEQWARRCKDWMEQGLDVYVYFDNDDSGHAPANAATLIKN